MNRKSKIIENEEILNAFYLLFDLDSATSIDFVDHIKIDEIKNAYRRKALETHPDRARYFNVSELEMSERFKEINLAYEKLSAFTMSNSSLFHHNEKHCKSNCYKPKPEYPFGKRDNKRNYSSSKYNNSSETTYRNDKGFKDVYFNGSLPRIELMLGQFLYYSGIISWEMLINSIVWQRRQRPLFGEIAKEWNILSEEDIYNILNRIKINDKIGEYALRNGYINQFEHMAIIGRQRYYKCPIGKYFLNNRIITINDLEDKLMEQYIHNYKVKNKRDFNY